MIMGVQVIALMKEQIIASAGTVTSMTVLF